MYIYRIELIVYIFDMIIDRLENIKRYYQLLPSLAFIDNVLKAPLEDMEGFEVNRTRSMLFICEKGSAKAATTWREVEYTHEVTGAVSLREGDFVLYLPGERYLVRSEGRTVFCALE